MTQQQIQPRRRCSPAPFMLVLLLLAWIIQGFDLRPVQSVDCETSIPAVASTVFQPDLLPVCRERESTRVVQEWGSVVVPLCTSEQEQIGMLMAGLRTAPLLTPATISIIHSSFL